MAGQRAFDVEVVRFKNRIFNRGKRILTTVNHQKALESTAYDKYYHLVHIINHLLD